MHYAHQNNNKKTIYTFLCKCFLSLSEEVEYPDDFEEEEENEDPEAIVESAAGVQQRHDDTMVEEFELRDAGGLTITLKALKEIKLSKNPKS